MFKLLKVNDPTCCYNGKAIKKQIVAYSDFATYTLPSDFVSLVSVEGGYNDNGTHKQLTGITINNGITTNEVVNNGFVFIQYLSNVDYSMSKYTTPVTIVALLVLTIMGYNVNLEPQTQQLVDSNTGSVVEEIINTIINGQK